jgi:hypothetical protein
MGAAALYSVVGAPFRIFSQEIVRPEWRAAMSGALMAGAGLSVSAMALGGGYLITALGYPGLFLAGAGFVVAGTFVFWICFRVPRRGAAHLAALDQVA